MRIKYAIIPFLAVALLVFGLTAGKTKTPAPELVWYTDLGKANDISQKTKKTNLCFFHRQRLVRVVHETAT